MSQHELTSMEMSTGCCRIEAQQMWFGVVKEGRKGCKTERAMESSRDPRLSETRAWR